MNFEKEKRELIAAYESIYVAGFSQSDISLIDKIVDYPLTYISNGKVHQCDAFPLDPAMLKLKKQWYRSKDWAYNVISINHQYAHMTATSVRCRKDGSEIEKVDAVYAFEKRAEHWKMISLIEMTTDR